MELLQKSKLATESSATLFSELPEDALRYRKISRKKIVANKDIESGEVFSDENLDFMRADDGIECSQFTRLVGKNSKKSYRKFEPILDLELN